MINISNIPKAQVLCALFNASKQQGMGFLRTNGAVSMSLEEAEIELQDSRGLYFDYLRGRVMKVGIGRDVLEPRLYDRDNGTGAAFRALAPWARRKLLTISVETGASSGRTESAPTVPDETGARA